jgi:DNA sulfur modification protein DndD
MFEFERLTLTNFALYNGLTLDLSPAAGDHGPGDSVLIRGHNEHGKTTLFRGLMWTVFGAEALNKSEQLSARDAMRLHGLPGKQEHVGQLIFKLEAARYRITRTAATWEDNDTGVQERVRVHRYNASDPSNPWKDDPSAERSLAEYYFPPDLAPYLFLNADKVSSIVGDVSATHQTDEVTRAINDMLGISAVKEAVRRVTQQRKAIQRDLSDKVGSNNEKERLEAAVAKLESDVAEQEEALDKAGKRFEILSRQIEETKSELRVLEEGDDATAVYTRRDTAKHERGLKAASYRDAMKDLRADFSSASLYLPFFTPQLDTARTRLAELRVEGIIPQAELPLLTKLLNASTNPDQKCICGETDIRPGTEAHGRLKKLVDSSRDFEEGANRLDKVREDLVELLKTHVAHEKGWAASFALRVGQVETARKALETAQSEFEDAEHEVLKYERQAKLEQIRMLRTDVQSIQGHLDSTDMQQKYARAKLDGGLDALDHDHGKGLRSELMGAQRKLERYYDTVRDAKHLAQAVKAADKVVEVLEATVRSIQADQVATVSEQMNYLFLSITNNGSLLAGDDGGNAPVTSKVGIREVPARQGHFELYAETAGGGSKPLAVLNGASRQALTVSFMVALLENSGAPIPLVTDSLFHPLSGSVKFRLAKHLLATKVQKITFFTHDDVQSPQIRNLLLEHAARTYTVSNSAKRHDLANQPTPNGAVAMVCTCGPDEFCQSCELAVVDGHSPTKDLNGNPSPQRVL